MANISHKRACEKCSEVQSAPQMNEESRDLHSRKLVVASGLEWNVLKVAIDQIIEDLEDLLSADEDPDLREDFVERLSAAKELRTKLDVDFE
jgi:hypothetical protein